MPRPLQGLRLLDLTRLLPGAVASMLLADLGAQIIKVEDPAGGDYARWMPPHLNGTGAFYQASNRNKQSIILNLKDPRGQAVLHRLAAAADVLLEGFRPGVTARLGCDYATLRALNPRLVYCSLSGWGQDGPYVEDSGHDLNYVALGGLLGAAGTPQPAGGQVADVGGAYAAVMGVLAALLGRERTGEGDYVDVALAEAALPFGMYAWVEALVMGTGSGSGGLTGGLACYNVYTAADGRTVALAALEPKFWANFCSAVERPEWLARHQNPDEQPALKGELAALFATRPAAEWQTLLGPADCCFSLLRPPAELEDDPQFAARSMLGRSEGVPWMRGPVHLSGARPPEITPAPGYGQHTRDVLRTAGYSDDEIDTLAQAGVVRQEGE